MNDKNRCLRPMIFLNTHTFFFLFEIIWRKLDKNLNSYVNNYPKNIIMNEYHQKQDKSM